MTDAEKARSLDHMAALLRAAASAYRHGRRASGAAKVRAAREIAWELEETTRG